MNERAAAIIAKLSSRYLFRNELVKAKQYARRAIALDPNSVDGYCAFADVCILDGQDVPEALEMLDKAGELEPESVVINTNKIYLKSKS